MNPGDSLDGRYEIIGRLGAGGMGEVYKARHLMLGTTRVIKVVHPNISTNNDARDRFLREARAATKVQHQNVATMHDFASLPDGSHYMVWELIDGENLAQRLRTHGTLRARQATKIAIQALRGLDAIHRAGIVHRDISPENLMITADDEVKIIDLGVAKVDDTDAVSQTRTGIFVGKLRYASPEQLGFLPDGEKIDGRTDIYALAMVLVELLTGRPPYEAKSPHEYFMLHAREQERATLSLPLEFPGGKVLRDVIEKALSRDRGQRYATAREFADALQAIEPQLSSFDGDETMKVGGDLPTMAIDTRAGTQVNRVDGEAAATIRTPLPVNEPAAVRTMAEATTPSTPVLAPAAVPQARLSSGVKPLVIVLAIAAMLVIVAGGAYFFWMRSTKGPLIAQSNSLKAPDTRTITTTSGNDPKLLAQPAQTAVTVTPTQTTSDPAWRTTPSTDPDPLPVTPKQVPQQPRSTPPQVATKQETNDAVDEPATPKREVRSVALYVDGGVTSRANDRAVDQLRHELRGVSKVALRAGSDTLPVTRAIRAYLPDLEFDNDAEVVIRWASAGSRLPRATNGRNATATISKGDRVIFRYEFDSGYAGDANSFARILADAMSE